MIYYIVLYIILYCIIYYIILQFEPCWLREKKIKQKSRFIFTRDFFNNVEEQRASPPANGGKVDLY